MARNSEFTGNRFCRRRGWAGGGRGSGWGGGGGGREGEGRGERGGEPFERARYGECRISAALLTANRPRWRFIGDELFLSRRRGRARALSLAKSKTSGKERERRAAA